MLYTVIFIGRSGCGKGTQAELLKEYLKTHSNASVLHVESGDSFRKFISGESHSSKLSKTIYDQGKLQPHFLSIWIWADLLVKNIKGNEHLIMDGIPRRREEVDVLLSAFEFYDRSKPIVIHLDISREEATKRMKSRGRMDDKSIEDVEQRLKWFDEEVEPTINKFACSSKFNYYYIDGSKSITEIHKEILSLL